MSPKWCFASVCFVSKILYFLYKMCYVLLGLSYFNAFHILFYVKILHKIQFYVICTFSLQNCYFCGIHFAEYQNVCYIQCLAYGSIIQCVLLSNVPHLLCMLQFDSNPLWFSFNHTVFHMSCILFDLKFMWICCKYCKFQNLLALAKTSANVFNAIKSIQNAT